MSERPADAKNFDFNDPLAGLTEDHFQGVPAEIVQKAKVSCLSVSKNIKYNGDLNKTIVLWDRESPYHEVQQTRLSAFYAAAISQKIDWMGAKSLERLLTSCFLKDLGMMKLPALIRGKSPARMTPQETTLFQQHPREGVNFLLQFSALEEAVRQVVYQHHECADGSGFPNGLSRVKIYPLAKVAALADFFATRLIDDRISPLDVLKRFMSDRTVITKFDPDIVRSLVKVFIKTGDSKK
ncbi:MAG: hypothetical protein A2X86_01370 [Bdellovibrionales bacterium GWA2_49_15]|nr:MAG: hypothetical protein A2X86_01370 [Bdellovibrionales bacterium GWA2_49_15]